MCSQRKQQSGHLRTKWWSHCSIRDVLPTTAEKSHEQISQELPISTFDCKQMVMTFILHFCTKHTTAVFIMLNQSIHIPLPAAFTLLLSRFKLIMPTNRPRRWILLFRLAGSEVKQRSSIHREFTVELALARGIQRKQTNIETGIWLLYWLSSIAH